MDVALIVRHDDVAHIVGLPADHLKVPRIAVPMVGDGERGIFDKARRRAVAGFQRRKTTLGRAGKQGEVY